MRNDTAFQKTIALAGNPNVGKSTLFNALTGLNQHTGNWPGKTVTSARGSFSHGGASYAVVDLPGCYSLLAHSAEEETARDFICFGAYDAVVVVCDATCLERNLNLVLQTLEMTPNVVCCVNLMDEAAKKGIAIDLIRLSAELHVPVVGTAARSKRGLDDLMWAVERVIVKPLPRVAIPVAYPAYLETAVTELASAVANISGDACDPRRTALMLLQGLVPAGEDDRLTYILADKKAALAAAGITDKRIRDDMVSALIATAERIWKKTVTEAQGDSKKNDEKIDDILTGKWTAFPIMLLVLLGIFWLTLSTANDVSQIIAAALFDVEDALAALLSPLPASLRDMLVLGVYRVSAWVVSVMLPPMAIFFPLFTLLEDVGFLPRVAFNLDRYYKKCCACGKQALTMCMGFGCNAAGVAGCRIIDSPRERLIAIITNSFVPCNGRFPTFIAVITMFFAAHAVGLLSAALLTAVILLGVAATFAASSLLSTTVLKGVPSSFTLELPSYRRPQVCKVLVRSVFDRTLFVLARAVVVAIPAGLVIWLMANTYVGGLTLLARGAAALDPFARLLGLDGVILLAFILGFPANEIVIPIMIMAYMSAGSLTEVTNLTLLKQLLTDNGWTWITAVSVMLFALMHWPCSTTLLTILKETQSLKWTAAAVLTPTAMGVLACFVFATVARAVMTLFS